MEHEYTEANLRLASPEKCKHYITVLNSEVENHTEYFWTECKLCGSKFNQSYCERW